MLIDAHLDLLPAFSGGPTDPYMPRRGLSGPRYCHDPVQGADIQELRGAEAEIEEIVISCFDGNTFSDSCVLVRRDISVVLVGFGFCAACCNVCPVILHDSPRDSPASSYIYDLPGSQ